ncbi:MAG: DUF4347 domain-containing protein [Cyanobacteria bacterium J06632_19]
MTTKNIIFIDSTVADYKTLASQAKAGTEVIVLDNSKDGVSQITQALAGKSDLASIQIISHGGEGMVQLGSNILSNGNLQDYSSQLQQWGNALAENGDILFYGCDVAAGESGVEFVQQLSELTGADIAASTDLTGNSSLGGDWDLEVATGKIESETAITLEAQQEFTEILPLTVEYFDGTRVGDRVEFREWYGRRELPDLKKRDWGAGTPEISGVRNDDFALRWMGYIYADKTGEYKFYEKSDDGVRLWVNNKNIIDKWNRSGFDEENVGSIYLEADKWYPIQMDYFEWDGNAAIELKWQPPDESKADIPSNKLIPLVDKNSTGENDSGYGLKGEYFNGLDLSGTPVHTQIDAAINFDWGKESPWNSRVNNENFSVRWTGSIIIPEDGQYKFYVEIDDRVRLWINNDRVIDRWSPGSQEDFSRELGFKKGQVVPVKLEYAEDTIDAKAKLFWEAKETSGKTIFDKTFIPTTSLIPYSPSERPIINVKANNQPQEAGTAQF